MSQPITVKYLPFTNKRGSRLKVTMGSLSATYSYYACGEEIERGTTAKYDSCEKVAFRRFCGQNGIHGTFYDCQLNNLTIFCPLPTHTGGIVNSACCYISQPDKLDARFTCVN